MDLFDLVARWYDRVLRFGGPEELLRWLQLQPGQRLLDVGGGTGRVSSTFPHGECLVVCDPSRGMLAEARGKGLRAAGCLAEKLPFRDGAWARMLIVDVFHHLANQRAAAEEMLRALEPGGRLVVEEPNIEVWAVKVVALAERLLGMQSVMLSLADLRRCFEDAGGAVVAAEAAGSAVRLVVTRWT